MSFQVAKGGHSNVPNLLFAAYFGSMYNGLKSYIASATSNANSSLIANRLVSGGLSLPIRALISSVIRLFATVLTPLIT